MGKGNEEVEYVECACGECYPKGTSHTCPPYGGTGDPWE